MKTYKIVRDIVFFILLLAILCIGAYLVKMSDMAAPHPMMHGEWCMAHQMKGWFPEDMETCECGNCAGKHFNEPWRKHNVDVNENNNEWEDLLDQISEPEENVEIFENN